MTILILMLNTICTEISMHRGQMYQMSDYAKLTDVIRKVSCTFVRAFRRHHHLQKALLECGSICNNNMDCAYFLLNGTECVLCEKYAGYMTPNLTTTQVNVLDGVQIFIRVPNGQLKLFVVP